MDIQSLNDYIDQNKTYVLSEFSKVFNKQVNMQSFNGTIGGKNFTYNVKPENYVTAQEYINSWMDNFYNIYEKEKHYNYEKSSHRIYKLLRDPKIKKFVEVYLTRTYLRKQINQ